MTTRTPPPGDDDPNAFRRAMAGVRPLPGRPAAPVRPRPGAVARFTRADRHELLHESHAMAADPAVLATDGELTFRRPCGRDETFRKLRRGRFAVEAEIDLHGLHRHAAQEALRQFLNDCVHRGLRCVRVIFCTRSSGPGVEQRLIARKPLGTERRPARRERDEQEDEKADAMSHEREIPGKGAVVLRFSGRAGPCAATP